MPTHAFSPAEIQAESVKLTREAELGRPNDLQHVQQELQKDMEKYSAKDYGSLIKGIRSQNEADVKANDHLPTLELTDSGKSGVPDTVRANYSDGTVIDAKGKVDATTSGGAAEHSLEQGMRGMQEMQGMHEMQGGHGQPDGAEHIPTGSPSGHPNTEQMSPPPSSSDNQKNASPDQHLA